MFELSYGSFAEQLDLFDLAQVGAVCVPMTMRDGFFYIANGESRKVMEFNSYGDLLALYSNEGASVRGGKAALKRTLKYPIESPSAIAVDSRRNIYVASALPPERQESDSSGAPVYCQTVLRFSRGGLSDDYIGTQGAGGAPFPYIKNIFVRDNDELVVVCLVAFGFEVYWFDSGGALMYKIPVFAKDVPRADGDDERTIRAAQDVIPDVSSRRLFVKVDRYAPHVDRESKVESGVDYIDTLVFPFDIEKEIYEKPVSIPPCEKTVAEDYSSLVFRLPYDFLGVSKNGWLFFMIATDDGFDVEAVNPSSQKIARRRLEVDRESLLCHTFALSDSGIISALLAGGESARAVWWRADELLGD